MWELLQVTSAVTTQFSMMLVPPLPNDTKSAAVCWPPLMEPASVRFLMVPPLRVPKRAIDPVPLMLAVMVLPLPSNVPLKFPLAFVEMLMSAVSFKNLPL